MGRLLATFIDLHTHTSVGSPDSSTTAEDIARLPQLVPALDGLALTEHVNPWSAELLATMPGGLLLFNEREYDFPEGHIVVLGAPSVKRGKTIPQLREHVLDAGGLMILAHPFRFYPSSLNLLFPHWHEPGEWPPERLAEHDLFGLVDAVEGWNHRATRAQNELASACAKARGLPVIAGSDSHRAADVGSFATAFESDVSSASKLIAAIRAGDGIPVERKADGRYRSLTA